MLRLRLWPAIGIDPAWPILSAPFRPTIKTSTAGVRGDRVPIGFSGALESVRKCGDRATAFIQDICCEKIRGCSCRVVNARLLRMRSHRSKLRCVLLNVRYAPMATKFGSAAK